MASQQSMIMDEKSKGDQQKEPAVAPGEPAASKQVVCIFGLLQRRLVVMIIV